MGLIHKPLPSQQKPPIGSQIDFSHPLSKGLVGCWILNEGGGNVTKDIAYSRVGTIGLGTWQPSINGKIITLQGGDTDSSLISAPVIKQIVGVSEFTIITSFFLLTASANDGIVTMSNSDANRIAFSLGDSGYGGINGIVSIIGNGANSYFYTDVNTIPNNSWNTIALVYNGKLADNASKAKLYKNSKQLNLTFPGGVIIPTTTSSSITNPIEFGNETYADGTVRALTGSFSYVYVYNRALSPFEIQSLYVSPYQFISRPGQRSYNIEAAATGVVPLRCLMGVGI